MNPAVGIVSEQQKAEITRVDAYPDVPRVLSLGDAHHPQELVDVVAAVADDAAEDDEHVVDAQRTHDVVRRSLVRRHRLANLSDQSNSINKMTCNYNQRIIDDSCQ